VNISILNLGRKAYNETLEIQRKLQQKRIDGEIGDVFILVEHDPVLTMGKRGEMTNVLASEQDLDEMSLEIAWVERGGDVTYHGPGQLVGYPIINLENYDIGLRAYIIRLQDVIINVLNEHYGIYAEKKTGKQTGVWVGNDKITAIGISSKKWVMMHGFAFNVNTDLSHFDLIVPCGLQEFGVTSVEKLLGHAVDFKTAQNHIIDSFLNVFEVSGTTINLSDLL